MSQSLPSSFVLPPDDNTSLIILRSYSILTPLACAIVGIRLAARYTNKGFKWDDLFITLALACAIIAYILASLAIKHGMGRHVFYLELPDIVQAVKYIVVCEFLLVLGIGLAKVSVLLFLLNIGGSKNWLRHLVKLNLALIISSSIALCIFIWFQCTPVRGNWDPTVPGRKCMAVKHFMDVVYLLTAITVLTDFLCALLPLPLIWGLHLRVQTRVGIMMILGLGLIAAGCSVVRVVLVKDFKASRIDPTGSLVNLGVWTSIELHIAIIVASLPPCRGPAVRLWAHIRGRKPAASTYGSFKSPSRDMKGIIEVKTSIDVLRV